MIKNDLTTTDVLNRITELYNKNSELISDVKDSIGILKETNDELKKAKELYEKSWSYFVKKAFNKYPRFSLITSIVSIIIIFLMLLFFFKDKNISYFNKGDFNEQKIKIEKNNQ